MAELSLAAVVFDASEGGERRDVGDVGLDGRRDGIFESLVVGAADLGVAILMELGIEELHESIGECLYLNRCSKVGYELWQPPQWWW